MLGIKGLQPRMEGEQANAESSVRRKLKQCFWVLYIAVPFYYKTTTQDLPSAAVTVDDLIWQLRT